MSEPSSASLADFLVDLSQRYPDNPAVGVERRTLSYTELEISTRRLAAWFRYELGLAPGDRVLVQLTCGLSYPVVLFGALRAGLVVVNLVNSLSAERIRQIVRDTEPKLFVYSQEHQETRLALEHSRFSLHFIEAREDDFDPWWQRGLLMPLRRKLALKRLPNHYALCDLISTEAMPGYTAPTIEPDSLAMIQYTGGTTGRSKGVLLSHRNLLSNMEQVGIAFTRMGLSGPERLLQPLGLYHSYPLMLALVIWRQGGYVALVNEGRDVNRMADLFERLQPTLFAGISPIFIDLIQHPLFSQLDFSSLKCTLSGAASVSDALSERWKLITGSAITQAYGVTEASPLIAMDIRGRSRAGCVGEPLVQTEVRVADAHNQSIPVGGLGELQIRGPQICLGYLDECEPGSHLTEDGWFRTGDLGRLTPDGEILFVGRAAEVIPIGGFRVLPSDIEAIVNAHPDVIDCAVVGVPDPQGEMQLKLFVVSNNRRLTHKQIRDYCRERLTRYKVPSVVEFREQLPHSPMGKVLRKKLLEES